MRRITYVLFAVFAIACAAACNALLGLDALDAYDDDGRLDGGGDAPLPVEGGEIDSGPPNNGGEAGAIGEAGRSPCDPDASVPPSSVHVSASSEAGAGATGTAAAPFATIAEGLAYARLTDAKTVVVEEGTYAERVEIQNVPLGIAIDGAWVRLAGVWTRDCSDDRASKTVIASPSDVAVVFRDVALKSTLTNLTLQTSDAPPAAPNSPGLTRYGVWIEDSTVVLDNVRVVAGSGSRGGDPRAGAPGEPLCAGFADHCVATPTSGTDAPPGASASAPGSFAASGFNPSNGLPGANPGGPGTAGTPPGPPDVNPSCEQGCLPESTCTSQQETVKGGAGHCGCGGGGGAPGGGGFGGGASIAVYAIGTRSSLLVTNSDLEARSGGDGSPGGAGGPGGNGTAGAPGEPAVCWGVGCCALGACPEGADCECYHPSNPAWPDSRCPIAKPASVTVAGGATGGAGQPGGRGSNGGGGAGGSAFTYVSLGAFVVMTDSRRAFGQGGEGKDGAAGGPTGEKP